MDLHKRKLYQQMVIDHCCSVSDIKYHYIIFVIEKCDSGADNVCVGAFCEECFGR